MPATLITLRTRIRDQVESASGFTHPTIVSAASATLTTLRDRVEDTLQDASNVRWSTADLDEAVRKALEQYSRRNPNSAISTITLAANGREISLSSISGILQVEKVWWDYDSTSPGYPPKWRQFEVWPGKILYIDDPDEPQTGDVVRIWYTKKQTLDGLDAAAATTIPDEDIGYIVIGASGFAAQARAVELTESLNVDKDVVARLNDWAEEQLKNFRYGISLKPPAWERYAYGYSQEDIDEAIRWALHRYSEINPDRAISTTTLAAAGREISLVSITGYLQIERVWWDYDSSAPGYPPNWRDFELWPGNVLWINDPDEPQSGDVVRVWYTRLHTVNGLDGASTTTFTADAETLIVTGASGFVAQERVQEQPGRQVPVRLREWADARLGEFERGLRLVARREAARHSGIATGPSLDRWDDNGWW